MARRRVAEKREILPDPKYNSKLVSRFISIILQDGKKSVVEKVFYGALDIIKEKTGSDPLKVFKAAVDNVKPTLEVKPRRVGGATYQVPIEVKANRKVALALRWIAGYTGQRKEKTMQERLAAELLDAYNNTGSSIKKKEDTHRMAEANRAFAHYRW
ncbi:MAG: 30S ribosomal protein S7 [Thermodesulfovibrionales bacterium]|nr:30S ribosomal protein S7 [Thermodesulfovibrionales bacterium]